MMHLLEFLSEDTDFEFSQEGWLENHPSFLWDPLGYHKNTVWEVNDWAESNELQPTEKSLGLHHGKNLEDHRAEWSIAE